MSVLASVTSIFPPPSFLRMPAVGVDVSDNSLKYVQFAPDRVTGQRLRLRKWGSERIKEGVLARGVVNDVGALGKALQAVRADTGAELVRLSLPEERAYVFETEISRATEKKEIRGQLEFRLEENVPLAPQDAYFDYMVLDDPLREDMLRVVVTVYAKETINAYYEACQLAKLTPLSFEVEAQAIARSTIQPEDDRTHMVIDLGMNRSGIGIVNNGVMLYTSTIDQGGETLSEAMRTVVGKEVDEKDITVLKNSIGLLGTGDNSALSEVARPVVDAILEEVKTRITYWNTRMQDREDRYIHSVILCGGTANLKGLDEYVSFQLQIPATRANVWKNTRLGDDIVPAIDKAHSYGYATAVGLGLASFV